MNRLPPLRDVLKAYGLTARKSLGQHFLLDQNITDKIARCAGDLTNTTVIEIGPGPGGLTRSLLQAGAKEIFAIEQDDRCIQALQDLKGPLHIIRGNALKTDVSKLGNPPRVIIANLPYNISTVLLIQWLQQAECFDQLILMFQKEVADRLLASPSTKAYGRLSIMTQWVMAVKKEFDLPASAFVPPPKVDSTVVSFTPHKNRIGNCDWSSLEKVCAVAFQQRRKMLRSSLKSLGSIPSGISPTARPEDLTVEDFCRLAEVLPNL